MPKTTKQIKFNTVEIREFPIVLSNNPSCHYGPSIELGWEYIISSNSTDGAIDISQYEMEREGKRRREKAGRPSKLYLSQVRREEMLASAGYSTKEVKTAVKDKKKARRQRSLSKFFRLRSRAQSHFEARRREKKLGRAVRNMNRIQKRKKNGSDSFYDNPAHIYSGWWLPFSAHYF